MCGPHYEAKMREEQRMKETILKEAEEKGVTDLQAMAAERIKNYSRRGAQ